MANVKKRPIPFILLFYLVCFAFRAVEYLVIRTDQSVLGEAFIHKLIGIGLLAAAVWLLRCKWRDIGFGAKRAVRNTGFGLLFAGGVYAIAYAAEMILQTANGNAPVLQFYTASYSPTGDSIVQDGILFVFICIVGNIINVVMEEGIFRGLFIRLAEEKYTFFKACLLSAALFGLWHIAQPVRGVLDGAQSPMGALMMSLMLVGTSALAGIQFTLLYKLTGGLWFGMAAHFVNNAVVNLLHVVTPSGADELQTVRISIAQALSFIVVLIVFIVKYVKQRRAA